MIQCIYTNINSSKKNPQNVARGLSISRFRETTLTVWTYHHLVTVIIYFKEVAPQHGNVPPQHRMVCVALKKAVQVQCSVPCFRYLLLVLNTV